MKYHISITKREIITAFFLIIGSIFLFKGIHSYYKMNHALSLDTLDEHLLKEGTYVTGDIDAYIGQKVYGSNRFSGVSQTLITFGKTYDFYTIPVGQNSYITIMAYGDLPDQLETFENGHGDNIYFEGIIVEPPINLNLKWYTDVDGFDTEKLIESFVIKEADFDRNKNLIYGGVILLAIAVLLLFSSGGIKSFVMEEVDTAKPVYNSYAKNVYSKDYELQAEKKQLETLERRLKSAKRSAVLCLVLLLTGIYIVYSAYLLEGKLFGVFLLIISVRGIWKYFINSDNTLAKSLAKRFTLKSLSVQIEEHKNNIKRLEEDR